MDPMPDSLLWLLFGLSAAIHVALAAGIAFQVSDLLKRLPENARRLSPGAAWLLLIPVFNCLWIWIVLVKLSASYQPSTKIWAISISIAYCVLFFFLNPNWAWVVALLLFIPYRKQLTAPRAAEDAVCSTPARHAEGAGQAGREE